MWIYGSIGFCVGMRGRNLYSYCACAAPAPPLSFSCVKKKEGEERKSLIQQTRRKRTRRIFSFSRKRKEGGEKKKPGQQTHGKRTHRIFLSYLLRIALAPKGAIVRIYAYLTGKRVLFPRYERADARSILERSPKLYNQVWSPCLRTASPINRIGINSRLRLSPTDPRMGSAA